MKLNVLGCSGGIGAGLRTTSFLIGDDILIDAGTGVGNLSLDQMAAINHVFLTHAHLDHLACLPLMLDAVGERRAAPLIVHAPQAVLDVLKADLFNDRLWPDFTRIPAVDAPWVRFLAIEAGQTVSLGGCSIQALPVVHSVPAVGYAIDAGAGSLAFSGDLGENDAFWQALAELAALRHLIVECAFPETQAGLAALSGHLVPSLLARRLQALPESCNCYISHLKPGQADLTMQQIIDLLPGRPVRRLQQGEQIEF